MLHQVLICETHVLLWLCQFWTQLRGELAQDGPYQQANIGGLRLQLPELQAEDQEARKIGKEGLKKGWEEIEEVLYHHGLPYVLEIVKTELISKHHDDLLASHFGIDKTQELIAQKYCWLTLYRDVEAYITGCDVCLTSKLVRHKPYGDLQSLPAPTHWWKDLSMDFVIGLSVSTHWKSGTYDSILVVVDRLTKMIYYELVKVTIDAPALTEIIIKAVVRHHGLLDSIMSDCGLVFSSKFWSLLCYYLGIKQKVSTAFHPQTDGQTERQHSTMELYLRAFINYEQDNWTWLLPMAKFAYNNAKNDGTGYTPFELNCRYHPRAFYKEDVNPHFQSKSADKLATKLRELMAVYRENLQHA